MKFELSKEQVKKFKEWKESLGKDGYDSFGVRFAFRFVPSGLGDSVTVIDLYTKQELDLSDDYD